VATPCERTGTARDGHRVIIGQVLAALDFVGKAPKSESFEARDKERLRADLAHLVGDVLFRPWMIAATLITLAIPITTPNMVRKERSFWLPIVPSATSRLSFHSARVTTRYSSIIRVCG